MLFHFYKKLIVIYSDKTFFVWDINDLKNAFIYRYNIFQNGGIKAMDYCISKKDNLIKIATCSDDKTVIYWNFRLDEFINNPLSSQKNQHIIYCKYIRHIFYFCKDYILLIAFPSDFLFWIFQYICHNHLLIIFCNYNKYILIFCGHQQ